MPAHLQAVIDAIFYRDLTERQAAAELGITRHQLRTRHAQALRHIRNNPKAV